jgi:hypothetical protein
MKAWLFFWAMAAPAAGSSLQFDHTPLGNAARVLSARFHVPVTILARAAAPISGDFSRLQLSEAMAQAAAQAGLEARREGPGFILAPPGIAPKAPEAESAQKPLSGAERRKALLRERAALLQRVGPAH